MNHLLYHNFLWLAINSSWNWQSTLLSSVCHFKKDPKRFSLIGNFISYLFSEFMKSKLTALGAFKCSIYFCCIYCIRVTQKMSHKDFELKSVTEVRFYFSTCVLEWAFQDCFFWTPEWYPFRHLKNAKSNAQTHNVLTWRSAVIIDTLIHREPRILSVFLGLCGYESVFGIIKVYRWNRLEMLIPKHTVLKVKSDFCNRFQLKIPMGHFWVTL